MHCGYFKWVGMIGRNKHILLTSLTLNHHVILDKIVFVNSIFNNLRFGVFKMTDNSTSCKGQTMSTRVKFV